MAPNLQQPVAGSLHQEEEQMTTNHTSTHYRTQKVDGFTIF